MIDKKEHPNLLVIWNPDIMDIKESVEVWNSEQICENCGEKGCYILRDDHNGVGVCRKHLDEEACTTGKTIIAVVELPDIHNY